MNNTEYINYLQSAKWREIAQKRLEIDGYKCQMCGCQGTQLNGLEVHHLSYKSIGHEENRVYEDLVTLCACCHEGVHTMMNRVTGADGKRGWKSRSDIPKH